MASLAQLSAVMAGTIAAGTERTISLSPAFNFIDRALKLGRVCYPSDVGDEVPSDLNWEGWIHPAVAAGLIATGGGSIARFLKPTRAWLGQVGN
jgi:hypothetical protein